MGDADDTTAQRVQATAQNFGFTLPDPTDPRNIFAADSA